jgi:hypothetical protein
VDLDNDYVVLEMTPSDLATSEEVVRELNAIAGGWSQEPQPGEVWRMLWDSNLGEVPRRQDGSFYAGGIDRIYPEVPAPTPASRAKEKKQAPPPPAPKPAKKVVEDEEAIKRRVIAHDVGVLKGKGYQVVPPPAPAPAPQAAPQKPAKAPKVKQIKEEKDVEKARAHLQKLQDDLADRRPGASQAKVRQAQEKLMKAQDALAAARGGPAPDAQKDQVLADAIKSQSQDVAAELAKLLQQQGGPRAKA